MIDVTALWRVSFGPCLNLCNKMRALCLMRNLGIVARALVYIFRSDYRFSMVIKLMGMNASGDLMIW